MKRLALVAIVLFVTVAPANAAPSVKVQTAHRMAERWADTPEPTNHRSTCWRKSRQVVKCRVRYHEQGIFEFNENGRWVPAQVDWTETVTVRRRKHWLVLTSNSFTGQMKQRG